MATHSMPRSATPESLPEDRKAAATAELARVLESPPFRGSRRCCRLLEYSVQQVLKGTAQEGLKERTIGIEALQRPPDYDTSEDAIVRVTANEVRKRLAQYYQAAGNSGNPMIALPPGSYAVTFQWPNEAPAPELSESGASVRRRSPWFAVAIVGLSLVVLGTLVYAVVATRAKAPPAASRSAPASGADPLWARIFSPGKKTNIVVSDTVYREIQYFLGRDVALSEYLAPGYPQALAASAKPELRQVIAFLGRQQTTSVGSATLGSRLSAFGTRLGGNPVIRYPRHLNAREFNTDNFILLGSRLSIPWEELFDSSLNFPLTLDAATHRFHLRNRTPRPGESPEYRESDAQDETYADIALVPNLGGTGSVLILNGIDMVAAETAGDFAMNGSLAAALALPPGAVQSPNLRSEVLIRIRTVGGAATRTEVVAVRESGAGR